MKYIQFSDEYNKWFSSSEGGFQFYGRPPSSEAYMIPFNLYDYLSRINFSKVVKEGIENELR